MTTYLIDTWYIQKADGTLEPVQNYATAKAIKMSDPTVRIVDIHQMKVD